MSQPYDNIDLKEEDSYDDVDYAPYELMEYESDADDEKDAEFEEEEKKNEKEDMEDEPDDFVDFYTTDADIKRGQESRELYAELARIAREEGGAARQKALETACYYMKGLVRGYISSKYTTYIENDRSYREDLEHEAYIAIMVNLPRYDATKAAPSTFFNLIIKSAMSHTTTRNKHQMSQCDASLKRKIQKIDKQYETMGRKATMADYVIETGETMSQIRSILSMMALDTNTHLESIPQYDQLIAGKADMNNAYETPENAVIRKMQIEAIIKRMHQLFTNEECDIYIRNMVDGENVPSIAKAYGWENNDDRVRRIIEKVGHGMKYDPIARSYYGLRQGPELNTIQFIPMEGTQKNMDILADLPL